MNISKLLATRQALLRQTQLANLAYAYTTLRRFADTVDRAQLRGLVKLCPAVPEEEQYLTTLTALQGNQSVLEEHFTDQDLTEVADALEFVTEWEFSEIEFRLEELREQFVVPVRQTLEEAKVEFDDEPERTPSRENKG